ncbi:hypothetical protein M8C13_20180 [Crossiella sp. SN42]|uniref:NACHT domain-containing protein n=1 Tax=Crossiella sp. SN42 TaxID=2944808 RepID=UPI00207D105A|nr:hypothetical protein [Crossiella sp. SN42]MCO1578075.1 hypothetical protein [Crossiella sp. SN42]
MRQSIEFYDRLEEAYLPQHDRDQLTLHELIAALDFHLRFGAMCAAAVLRERDPDNVALGRTMGFGGLLAYLGKAARLMGNLAQGSRVAGQVVCLIAALKAALAPGIASNEFGTIEQLRNHIYHGNPVPSGTGGTELRTWVANAAAAASAAIRSFLDRSKVVVTAAEGGLDRVELRWLASRLDLWPFICADSSGNWCLFSSFARRLPTYACPGQRETRRQANGERLIVDLHRSMLPRAADSKFVDFIEDLRTDLEGFRDLDHQPHHDENDGVINMVWMRATGVGTEQRSDCFRIGANEERQWRDDGTGAWVPYTELLRTLANWPVVARSIRQYLQECEDELIAGERAHLGWNRGQGVQIEPRVRLGEMHGNRQAPTTSFAQLVTDIDDRLQVRGPETRIYFVTGEAGIGKTRALVSAALRRAQDVEAEEATRSPGTGSPLFLYVRSAGQAASKLQTVVSATVARTRSLTETAVRALCRNGLMALFIDGFDELLGGVGYDDALGSMRPWIEAMSGRGVILVSARSSYYLNQYQSSLRRNLQNQNLAVQHRVAEMLRWSPEQVGDFFDKHGIVRDSVEKLSEDDRRLLSLPFFARVYVESAAMTEAGESQLADLIVEQYLTREAGKLLAPGDQGKALLSEAELRSTFQNLAEMMAAGGERAMSDEELAFAASMAISTGDLESRRGLEKRLPVLCGITVSEGGKRFEFQHELFYDIFLADFMVKELSERRFAAVKGKMIKSQWRIATASRIVRLATTQARALLDQVCGGPTDLPAAQQEIFRVNLGTLWTELARRTGSLSGTVAEAEFVVLDLTEITTVDVLFENCRFQCLKLPPKSSWSLGLIGCEIDELWVTGTGIRLTDVSLFEEVRISQLLHQGTLLEKPGDIAAELRGLGAPLPAVEQTAEITEFEEAVGYFLGKIRTRADSLFVYEHKFRSANENSGWTRQYSDSLWYDFIRALRDSGAAELVQHSAKGSSLLRVRFLLPVDRLIERDDDEIIQRFWCEVAYRG